MSYVYPPLSEKLPRHALLDSDMVDWFMADPLAAVSFFRENRVQILDSGADIEPVRVMILTRDSVPGLSRAS